ncbi:MAG: DUF3859 domain-containing protein [Gammaproteobacteria bacterium]
MKYLISIILTFSLVACDRAGDNPNDQSLQGKVTKQGIYRLVRSGGMVNNPKTSTGKAISKPVVQWVKTTDRIPLIKGVRMYLQYRMWYFPDLPAYVDLRRVVKHPAMTLPDGTVSTGSDFMIKRKVSSNQVMGYTGYGLDEDYELVEGNWVIELWYQDKKLIEQTFTTYWPDKEEIASLNQVLQLGNKVMGQVNAGNKSKNSNRWPSVLVGKKDSAVPAGVTDVQKSLEKPMIIAP